MASNCISVFAWCSLTKQLSLTRSFLVSLVILRCYSQQNRIDYVNPWNIVILGKLIVVQPVKIFRAFFVTRKFINAFKRSHKWSVCLEESILHSLKTYFPKISLILPSRICHHLPNGLLSSGFQSISYVHLDARPSYCIHLYIIGLHLLSVITELDST
jgi:hypothetical protein